MATGRIDRPVRPWVVPTLFGEYTSTQYRLRETLRLTQDDISGHELGQSLPRIQSSVQGSVPLLSPPLPFVPASARSSDARVTSPPSPGELDRDILLPVSASDNKASEVASGAYPRCWHTKERHGDYCDRVVDVVPTVRQEPQDPMSAVIVSLCLFLFGHILA